MKKLLFLLIAYSIIFYSFAQDLYLAYTTDKDKIGYINSNGEEVVAVKYDDVNYFTEGLLAVNIGAVENDNYEKIGGLWGYVDTTGKEVISLKYEMAKEFREGLAPVKKDGKYGFIDKNENTKIEFIFEDARAFSEGFAAVKADGFWGFINHKGEFVIPAKFDGVSDFDEKFSVVFHKEGEYEDEESSFVEEYGKYGLINQSGTYILEPIYTYIGEFNNGFAKIEFAYEHAYDTKEGFINTNGEIIIPTEYDGVKSFSEGLAAVSNFIAPKIENPLYTKKQVDSLERELNTLFPLKNSTLDDLNKKLNHPLYREYSFARSQTNPKEEITYGYINEKGDVVIDFKYRSAEPFINEIALVRFGEQTTIMVVAEDKNGNITTSEDLTNRGFNLIDKNGKLLLNQNYNIINRYKDGFIFLQTYPNVKVIDENLKPLFQKNYIEIDYIGNNLFVVQEEKGGKKYVINTKEEKLIDLNFMEIKEFTIKAISPTRILIREERSKSKILDINGKLIKTLKYEHIGSFEKVD